MKIYSNDTLSRAALDEIDAKQTAQIRQTRIWLGVSFAVNVLLTLALHFL